MVFVVIACSVTIRVRPLPLLRPLNNGTCCLTNCPDTHRCYRQQQRGLEHLD